MKLKIQIIVVVVLVATIVTLSSLYKRERTERIRTEGNQTVLLDSIQHYTTQTGKNAVTIGTLNLKVNELKTFRTDDAQTIKDLNLKIKRVQSISNTATKTSTKIKTVFKDRIVEVKVLGTNILKRDTLRCLEYVTPYLTIEGCINQHSEFEGLIVSRDTLKQIIHRIPKKFLFIKFGTKAIRQEVFSMNPDTYIDFAEYIELKKRRK